MTTLFFFGAGASHGSVDCTPYCPPLGCQLFDELQKASAILNKVHTNLADLFRRDFEKGMDKFFVAHQEDVPEFLRDMARYFAQFEPGPNSLYKGLIDKLTENKEKFVLATTNYDLLIEITVNQARFFISYSGLPVEENNIPLIKMHGSCNFLPKVHPDQIKNVRFQVPMTGSILDAQVLAGTAQDVIEFCQVHDSIAPAIAMYHELKWVPFCRGFVAQQREFWRQEVYGAKQIFVIGTAIHEHDKHIWEPLAKASAWLGYVGLEWDDFRKWAGSNNRKQISFIAETFKDAVPIITRNINSLY